MTRQPDVDRLLESWLAEGPSELPDRVVHSIVSQLDTTSQRRLAWLPGREQMNRMMYAIGGVAAIVIVVAAGAFYLGGRGPGIGASPSPSPTVAPAPTASPAPAAKLGSGATAINGTGRYWTEFQGYRYTFTIRTPNWSSNVKSDARVIEKVLAGPMAALFVFGEVGDLSSDACHWEGATIVPGPTVDDLAAAIAATVGFDSSEPDDVTLAGYSGKHVRLTVPADTLMGGCDNAEYHGIAAFYAYSPGQVQDIWVLDLDGTRVTLFTTWEATVSTAAQQEVAELANSIEIEPAP